MTFYVASWGLLWYLIVTVKWRGENWDDQRDSWLYLVHYPLYSGGGYVCKTNYAKVEDMSFMMLLLSCVRMLYNMQFFDTAPEMKPLLWYDKDKLWCVILKLELYHFCVINSVCKIFDGCQLHLGAYTWSNGCFLLYLYTAAEGNRLLVIYI